MFVIYAFGHGTSKCNEILQEIPIHPGEGQDGVGGTGRGVEEGFSWFLENRMRLFSVFQKFRDFFHLGKGQDGVGGTERVGRVFPGFWKTV